MTLALSSLGGNDHSGVMVPGWQVWKEASGKETESLRRADPGRKMLQVCQPPLKVTPQ